MQPSKAFRLPSSLNSKSSGGHARLLALVFATVLAIALPISAGQEQQSGEIVANLATGRVVFCVTHDAIIVAATSGGGEVGSSPPTVLPVSPGRVGVLLGAIEWTVPATGKITRFDADLPSVATDALRRPAQAQSLGRPSMAPPPNSVDQPSEIEDIGVGMLEEIRPMVEQIHHKLDLAPDEPLVELILADYVQNYGPEIWTLQYRVRQENLGSDFWQTRILRPAYYQLYPPEKGHAHTFVEEDYPANVPKLDLAGHVAGHDPQFERIARSSREGSQAFDSIAAGNSAKALSSPVSDFMRAAIPLAGGDNQSLVMALLDMDRGFQWILAPQKPIPAGKAPSEPRAPSLRQRGPRPQ
jgi:hypothetical protein